MNSARFMYPVGCLLVVQDESCNIYLSCRISIGRQDESCKIYLSCKISIGRAG